MKCLKTSCRFLTVGFFCPCLAIVVLLNQSWAYAEVLPQKIGFEISETTPKEAIGYFVNFETGNDKFDGKSDAKAWKTFNNVNAGKVPLKSNLYLRAGQTWKQQLKIGWSGTKDNRVIVGAYYLEDGRAMIGVGPGGKKPTIQGGYSVRTKQELSKLTRRQALGNIPAVSIKKKNRVVLETQGRFKGQPKLTAYQGLVSIGADYVTVQDLVVRDSSSFGIVINGEKRLGGKLESYTDNIIQSTEVYHTVGGAIRGFKGSHRSIARNNIVKQCVWSTFDGVKPYKAHPGCIVFSKSDDTIIENNLLEDNWGEGIILNWGGTGAIIRKNIVTNTAYVGIYINGTSDVLIEDNIITNNLSTLRKSQLTSGGIAVHIEPNAWRHDSIGIVIKGNHIVNVKQCFYTGVFKKGVPLGRITGGVFTHNVCENVEGGIIFKSKPIRYKRSGHGTGWEIADNTFLSFQDMASRHTFRRCERADREFSRFHRNYWIKRPESESCQGKGDRYGSSLFTHPN